MGSKLKFFLAAIAVYKHSFINNKLHLNYTKIYLNILIKIF